jgi:hypothetical protein
MRKYLMLFAVGASCLVNSTSQAALVAHWTADDLTASLSDGSAVSGWTSLAGSVNAAQATTAKQPLLRTNQINGHAVVSFDGSNDLLKYTDPLTNALDYSIVAVFRTADTVASTVTTQWYDANGIVDGEYGGAQNDYGLSISAGGEVRAGIGNPDLTVRSAAGLNNSQPHVAIYRRDAAGGAIGLSVDYSREAVATGAPTGNRGVGQAALGALQTDMDFLAGDIAEVRLFNHRLSDSEVSSTLNELAVRYAVSAPTPTDQFRADDLASLGNGRVLASGDWHSAVGSASANVTTGDATLRTDAIGSHAVVNFTGNDGLQIINGAMSGANDFSVAVVYRANSGVGGSANWYQNTSLVDSEQAGSVSDWGMAINSTGQIAAGLGNPDRSLYSSTSGYYRDGLPHVAIFTRRAGQMNLYVDGSLVGSRSDGGTAARNAVDYFFGQNHTGGNRFDGDIAEVQVYGEELVGSAVERLTDTLRSTYSLSPYPAAVLTDHPSHYLRLGEGNTTAAFAYDEVAARNGTYPGAYANSPMVNQPGGLNKDGNTAVKFDGANDYIRVANDLGVDFTLECLINTSTNSRTAGGWEPWSGDGIIWADWPGGANDFILAVINNGLSFLDGNGTHIVHGTTNVVDGCWHHVAVSRQAGGLINLYLDGRLEAFGAAGTGLLNARPYIDIGGNTGDSRYFNGLIDEVAFYNAVLTQGQISQHYVASIVPEPSSLALAALGLVALASSLLLRRRHPGAVD